MLSRTTEYALRAAVSLARSGGAPCTAAELAAATRLPAGYLAKVLQSLARAGIVRSQRGLGGGFVLARPAAEISALELVNAVDPIPRIRSCPLDLPEHRSGLCQLHRKLDEAYAQIEASFRHTSLADLSQRGGGRRATPAWPPAAPSRSATKKVRKDGKGVRGAGAGRGKPASRKRT